MSKSGRGLKLSDEEIEEIRALYKIFPSIRYVANETGHDYKTIKKYIRINK
ncbi:MAG: hypothetical protein PVF58_00580 [Candidatus Methanofastidiosia archaeon]|jgi:hypothetical protein